MDPSTPQQAPLPDGSDVGGYDITRTLGFGTFGIVYRAEGHVLEDPVAIKEFFPRDIADRIATEQVTPKQDHAEEFAWALERFVREAKTLRELAEPQPHPNIIQVRHVIQKNGTSYFVMKWEDGEALEAVLEREPRWDEKRLRKLLDALLAGLEHVHDADVLHRDIKPSNILIRPDGTPVLIDFGSARRVSGDQDRSKYVQLTPAFAPPEQQYGQYGKWTDIYILAATLFCALTGKPDPAAAGRVPGLPTSYRASTRTASYAASTQPWSRITGSVRNPSPSGVRRWAWGRIGARPIRTKRGMGPRSVTRRQPSSCRNRGPTNRSKQIRPQSSCLPP